MAGLNGNSSRVDEIHVPVLLERTLQLLEPALAGPNAVFVDATLGMGGHSFAVLSRFPNLKLIGIDRDNNALEISRERLGQFGTRVSLFHGTYDRIPEFLRSSGISNATAILFDLGVSSLQIDDSTRGFSYSRESDLDMRMDQSGGLTAAKIIAEYDETALRKIFWEYGEEKFAPRIARRIVQSRSEKPIETSMQLVEIIESSIPASQRRSGHPAKRVFQALRVEVNRELQILEVAIPAAIDSLAVGGRIVVLSYQSLEDRIVKRIFAVAATSSSPKELPVELPGHGPILQLLTRGAEKASPTEINENSRSASVRLRAAERIAVAA